MSSGYNHYALLCEQDHNSDSESESDIDVSEEHKKPEQISIPDPEIVLKSIRQELEYKPETISKQKFQTKNSCPENKRKHTPNTIIKNRMLCFNILNNNECSYQNRCRYAHFLEEQQLDDEKKRVIDMIKSETSLHDVNLTGPDPLYKNLVNLTKLCNGCRDKTCTGGYNCRFGACHKDIQICYNDLQKGDCKNKTRGLRCENGIHLTLRNLVPYVRQKIHQDFPDNMFLKQTRNSSDSVWDDVPDSVIEPSSQPKVIRSRRIIRHPNSTQKYVDFVSDSDTDSDSDEDYAPLMSSDDCPI